MGYDLHNHQYPYPLNYLASDGGTVDDGFVDGNIDNTNVGDNWYVLCLTGQQMNDLQSVIAIGAPIAFPDTYMDTIQRYAQLAEFPNEIPEDTCMDLCQLILDCIGDTPALQQAIAQYSLFSPIPQNAPEVQANLDAQLINDPPACDDDMIFGMTTGYTDLMNTISEDILEILIQASSPAGRIGDMIEAIPIIGEAPVDDIFQFVESFLNDLLDAYSGAYTSQIRDDIRCDLFCLAKVGCVLTLEDARDYFFEKLDESISLDLWDGFLDDIIDLSYSGTSAIWALHLLITQTIIFGGELIGFDVNRLVATIQSLFNDPDSDWTFVCSTCEWTHIIGGVGDTWDDYSAETTGFYIVSGNKLSNSGVQNACDITFPIGYLDSDSVITSVDVTYKQGRNAPTADFVVYQDGAQVFIRDSELGEKSISFEYSTPVDDTESFRILIDIGLSSGPTSNLNQITFHGLGNNPFL